MLVKRQVLDLLTRDELLDLVDHFEVDLPDRRVKRQLVDTLTASQRASLGEILPNLSRDCLKGLCEAFALDASGRRRTAATSASRRSSGRRPTSCATTWTPPSASKPALAGVS